MITTRLLPNGHHEIFQDGKKIGEIWRVQKLHRFRLNLKGIYWTPRGEPTTVGGAVDKDFSSMRAAIKYVEGMTVLEVYPALNALDYKNKCPLCEAGLKPTKKHGITFTKPDGSQVVGMVSEQLYNAIGRAAKAGPGVTRIPSRRSEKWKRFRRWLHFTRWTMPWHLFKPVNFEGDHWMQDKVSYVGGVKVISIECSCGRVF